MEYNELTDKERYYSGSNQILDEYAKDVRFSNNQLEIIRHGIENGLDISVYANPEIPVEIMKMIFNHLKNSNNKYLVRVQDKEDGIAFIYCTCKTKRDALNCHIEFGDERPVIDIREYSEI